jgi:carbon-monoxide dehydrogenase small subunit
MKVSVHLKVNGQEHDIDVDSRSTLLEVLRETLGLTSVHRSCEEGECGACTILLNGEPVSSCLVLAAAADGAEILTTEGLKRGETLHPLMDSFLEHHGLQCGFCTPGLLMTAYALIEKTNGGQITEAEIRKGIEGNICRCTGYMNIVKAIQAAMEARRAGNWW